MFTIVQTIYGSDRVVATSLDIESATTQAEARHINTSATRTRVIGKNGRVVTDSTGKPADWVRK